MLKRCFSACILFLSVNLPAQSSGNYAIVKSGDGYFAIDPSGKRSSPLQKSYIIRYGDYLQLDSGIFFSPSTQHRFSVPDGALVTGLPGVGTRFFLAYAPSTNEHPAGYGYFNRQGSWKLKPNYSWAEDFRDDHAVVALSGPDLLLPEPRWDVLRLWTIIDTTGTAVLPKVHAHRLRAISGNRAAFLRDSLWGYIDGKGNEIIPCRYTEAGDFSNGVTAVKTRYGYQLIDTAGRTLSGKNYKQLYSLGSGLFEWSILPQPAPVDYGDIAIISHPAPCGLLDNKGKEITRAKFTDMRSCSEGVIGVFYKKKCGYIRADGKPAFKKRFDYVTDFHEGLALVKVKEKWGFINTKGKLVIPAIYADARMFSNGLAAVLINEKWGYIDASGKVVIEARFDEAYDFE